MLTINVISVVVPLVVAFLLSLTNKVYLGEWSKNLSHVIGVINSLTTVVLILGLIFIRQNKLKQHRAAMISAFSLGAMFLVCYITYHISNPANKFYGQGASRYVYFVLLISHIGLSLIVLPLVLRAMYYALTSQISRHKRIVKYAYPTWLYVSISGVIVYLMLYHLFPIS